MIFTQAQIDNWIAYERVRQSGNWNMFDPRAIQASALSQEEYIFVMKNYSELKAHIETNVDERE